jgi:hypothetical protein
MPNNKPLIVGDKEIRDAQHAEDFIIAIAKHFGIEVVFGEFVPEKCPACSGLVTRIARRTNQKMAGGYIVNVHHRVEFCEYCAITASSDGSSPVKLIADLEAQFAADSAVRAFLAERSAMSRKGDKE